MTFKHFLIYFAIVITASHAQDQSQQRPIKHVEFRLMSWSENIEGFNYESEKKQYAVDTISSINRSKNYRYTGSDDLVFFSITQSKDGQIIKTPILRVPYETLNKNILVLINDSSKPYTCRVLDENPDKFTPGSFRLVNFSRRHLKFMLGTQYGEIPASGLIDAPPPASHAGDILSLKFAAAFETGPRVIYSNRWLYDPSERVMIFIIESGITDNNGFMTKIFSERYSAPEKNSQK